MSLGGIESFSLSFIILGSLSPPVLNRDCACNPPSMVNVAIRPTISAKVFLRIDLMCQEFYKKIRQSQM